MVWYLVSASLNPLRIDVTISVGLLVCLFVTNGKTNKKATENPLWHPHHLQQESEWKTIKEGYMRVIFCLWTSQIQIIYRLRCEIKWDEKGETWPSRQSLFVGLKLSTVDGWTPITVSLPSSWQGEVQDGWMVYASLSHNQNAQWCWWNLRLTTRKRCRLLSH